MTEIKTEPVTGTALTAPVPTDLQALFKQPDGIKAELARIKAKAFDAAKSLGVTKAKDRDAIKSVAFQVVKRKTALDAAGKELNEERRKLNAAVDEERRLVRDTLDRVADDIRAPVLVWEAKEAERISAIRARMDQAFVGTLPAVSADLIAIRAIVDAVPMDASWSEFLDEAVVMKARRLDQIGHAIDAAVEREEAAAELARLRKEAADRADADRLARIAEAAEAAERQREADEAAATAKAAQDAAEAAQRKAEKEAADLRQKLADAEAREAAGRAAQAQRAADAKLAAEMAAEKARQDEVARIAREAAAIEQAKRDEAARIAAEQAAAEFQAAMARRAEARRAEAIYEIEEDLCEVARLDLETMNQIVNALMMGKIRNVQVVL